MKHTMSTLRVLLLLVIALLSGCSDSASKSREQFMSGCVQGGSDRATCSCVFDGLQSRYTEAQLQDFNRDPRTPQGEEIMRHLIDSTLKCSSTG